MVAQAGICYEASEPLEVLVNFVEAGQIQGPQALCSGVIDPDWILVESAASGELSWSWTLQVDGQVVQESGQQGFQLEQALGADGTLTAVLGSELLGVTCESTAEVFPVELNAVSPAILPSSEVVCVEDSPDLISPLVQSSGDGELSFQWFASDSGQGAWTAIPGENGESFQPPLAEGEEVFYQLQTVSVLHGVECLAVSEPFHLIINAIDAGFAESPSEGVCVGGEVVVSSLGYDGPPEQEYSWYVGRLLKMALGRLCRTRLSRTSN